MLGVLTDIQIESLLKQQVTGRLACHAGGTTYIVPINYFYSAPYIYSHSAYGKKIEMMRQNPEVCFEVDDIQSIFSWKSVVAWGRFEEVTDIDEKARLMQGLIHRIMPLANHPANHPSHGITENDSDVGEKVELIIYKINLDKITGRFEKN
ncbi:pyridoxamine 5'-phosphate oxidase family protein [Mucilaginibacter ginsenosidivorax]|uniref:Pyridoxamine 5'-phosphate oxidase family protein n=1 Tax=Mucilaginibacter ginsenosidivorax TaxID=862126 RepID=A0A5B8W3L5_9SPHI|nr:pyridoxamine 5'-phosphate oxidase family protein [Mucilaginibacter ginsenosidivorax]QEC76898.1 pyridoxamine 5'-phosphate oxidase family protein [Mucilaginibacter ginsenosidivorax]